jgi:hypothetical protein
MWEQRARVMRPHIYHDNFHDLTFDTIFYLQARVAVYCIPGSYDGD